MFDYHIHSNLSFDAYDSPVRCAMAARDKGLTEICMTEHHELDYPYNETNCELDFSFYDMEIIKAREVVPEIIVRKGVEVSLRPAVLKRTQESIKGRGFDFIIASQHTIKEKDPYFGDGFEGKTLREAQREYLEEMLYDLQNFDDYDVIGHIGYIDKYLEKAAGLTGGGGPFTYADFHELLDEILRTAISKGKGIEVNTSNYFVYDYPTPHPSIIKRFAELGGEVMTMGSDAHFSDAIGHRFRDAVQLMKQCGVKYVCTFEQRKPSFIPREEL